MPPLPFVIMNVGSNAQKRSDCSTNTQCSVARTKSVRTSDTSPLTARRAEFARLPYLLKGICHVSAQYLRKARDQGRNIFRRFISGDGSARSDSRSSTESASGRPHSGTGAFPGSGDAAADLNSVRRRKSQRARCRQRHDAGPSGCARPAYVHDHDARSHARRRCTRRRYRCKAPRRN